MGLVLLATAPGLGRGVAPPYRRPWPRVWGVGYLLPAAAPDLRRRVTPLVDDPDLGCWVSPLGRPPTPDLGCRLAPFGRSGAVAVSYSRPLPLTLDMG